MNGKLGHESSGGRRSPYWRVALWGMLASPLVAAATAMRFTREVDWTAGDFVVMGALLGLVGLAIELTVRASDSLAYRAGAAAAVLAAFLLVWINLAVGIIGSEDNDANALFLGMLAVALGGALLARFRARGMACAMAAAALGQAAVGALALAQGWGADGPGYPMDIIGCTGLLTGVWLGSAGLFRKAAAESR